MDSLEHCVILYDLKDILVINKLRDVKQFDSQVEWGPLKYYLSKDVAKIPLSIVVEHKADANMFCSKNYQQSSN